MRKICAKMQKYAQHIFPLLTKANFGAYAEPYAAMCTLSIKRKGLREAGRRLWKELEWLEPRPDIRVQARAGWSRL